MTVQRRIARASTRILSMLPMRTRYNILLRMLRHSAADSLDIALAAASEEQSANWCTEFFDELRTITRRLGAPAPSSGNGREAAAVLKSLLDLDNELYRAISAKAREYDEGVHPKHRLTRYHDFFCENVGPEESVLDIGCGNGFLTSDVAKCTRGRVVGIDMNENNIAFAKARYQADNIEFICGDVKTDLGDARFDVVMMSNVLEHLSARVEFLRQVRETAEPAKFLIRVPMYEREWMVPLKEELGIKYVLDAGHEIEYTQESLFEEFRAAGLEPEECEIRWGEIWCRAVSVGGAEERGREKSFG